MGLSIIWWMPLFGMFRNGSKCKNFTIWILKIAGDNDVYAFRDNVSVRLHNREVLLLLVLLLLCVCVVVL
jgi:hypothetical protein